MKKISVWTIILILVSAYFIYLSVMEYQASSISKEFADEQFEIHLKDTPEFPVNYVSMSQTQREEYENKNTINKIQNEIDDNWNMDTYISWGIRAKIHFQMALLSILLTIVSWRFDILNARK